MNLRRMNVTERVGPYTKFTALILLLILIIILLPNINKLVSKYRTNIPLENRTCEEVYNLTQHDELYMNDKKIPYKSEQVILYYLKNCQT